jgi:hypothetical protein
VAVWRGAGDAKFKVGDHRFWLSKRGLAQLGCVSRLGPVTSRSATTHRGPEWVKAAVATTLAVRPVYPR